MTGFVSEDRDGLAWSNENARVLALHLGTPFVKGRQERVLVADYDARRRRLTVSHEKWSFVHSLPREVRNLLAVLGFRLLVYRVIMSMRRSHRAPPSDSAFGRR